MVRVLEVRLLRGDKMAYGDVVPFCMADRSADMCNGKLEGTPGRADSDGEVIATSKEM